MFKAEWIRKCQSNQCNFVFRQGLICHYVHNAMSFTLNAKNTTTEIHLPPPLYSLDFPHQMAQHVSDWHSGSSGEKQVQSALRRKLSASGVNRALCLPLHVPSLLLVAKPGGTASPACCSAGRGPSTGGWRHAAQASHVLAAHVALKAQRSRMEGGGVERRSSNASGLILQPRL